MKFLIKKIYITLFLLTIILFETSIFAKDSEKRYTKENISNYFLGIISSNQDYNQAFKHLKKVQSIKDNHSKFNVEFVRTLVLLNKFEKAFEFSKSVWKEKEFFFEADLLIGLEHFVKKDFTKAEKHFKRLNKISNFNLFFEDFVGNVLIAWSKASQGNKEDSYKYLKKIPKPYYQLVKTQNSFLKCYFDEKDTKISFQKIINDQEYNFSRYNFFLINYLLYKNDNFSAAKTIKESRENHSANLLLKQTEHYFLNNKIKTIKSFFDCQNPNDSLAEFFYVIANLYSNEKNYQLSNFYLQISQFLNKKFITNKALLAENYYFHKKKNLSKNIYKSLKSVGSVYSWHASKSIANIILEEKGKELSISFLEDEFRSLSNRNFEHYYEMANFYKDIEYYKKSIKYYTLVLQKITEDHYLVPKILDRRGTSFERIDEWEKAEKDLLRSLEILPDQAHVLNYLAYSWVDKGINLEKGLEMLIKANELRKNDGYIIDSLGWAYFAKKNYKEAEFFLQQAVELLPSDPIINDHYADALWMLDKNIQARYVWKSILELEGTKKELKDIINKKLIFGITKKL